MKHRPIILLLAALFAIAWIAGKMLDTLRVVLVGDGTHFHWERHDDAPAQCM